MRGHALSHILGELMRPQVGAHLSHVWSPLGATHTPRRVAEPPGVGQGHGCWLAESEETGALSASVCRSLPERGDATGRAMYLASREPGRVARFNLAPWVMMCGCSPLHAGAAVDHGTFERRRRAAASRESTRVAHGAA